MTKRCSHCRRRKIFATWTARPCALGRSIKIRLCARCDVLLNAYVLLFIRTPKARSIIKRYAHKVMASA